ncbi:3'-5' RNA helicase YTHDC2 [Nematostella vectensis]|uniref:3'-5' RNA helicase YTHDC2 n=1 Tax=Nematostella vectensis TaxID=45351 RepID=UPI00138FD8AF|nr:3'-5' RNA helicase YTHDC2 [Nematostella vectensis]
MADKRGPKGLRNQNICVKEEFKIAVKIALDKFRYDETQKELEFPSSFTAVERAYIHRLCLNLGLKSRSRGKGSNRFLSVSNKEVKAGSSSTQIGLCPSALQVIDSVNKKFPLTQKERQDLQPRSERQGAPFEYGRRDKFSGKLSSIPPAVPPTTCENELTAFRKSLPIWEQRQDIIKCIKDNQVILVSGETGSGKTTQVPQFILEYSAQVSSPCRIICTQPRRISAMSVAERVAAERGERIGQTAGYQIRLESRVSGKTLLTYCTNGVLLRTLMQGDNSLSFITHIIVDEIHERDRFSDFLLISLRELLSFNKNIKLVLMSAALDIDLFVEYFGKCPVINVPGRCFDVDVLFLEDVLHLTSYKNKGMERHYKEDGKESFIDKEIQKDLNNLDKVGPFSKQTLDVDLKPCPGVIHLPAGSLVTTDSSSRMSDELVGEAQGVEEEARLADEEPDNDVDLELAVLGDLELNPVEDDDPEQKIVEDSQEKGYEQEFPLEEEPTEEELLSSEEEGEGGDDEIIIEADDAHDDEGREDSVKEEESLVEEMEENKSQGELDDEAYLLQEMDDSISQAWLKGDDDSFVQILHLIMNENISVDYQHSETQATALMVAAGRGCAAVVEQLLALGANPHIRDPKNNWIAIDWAKKWDHTDVIELLDSNMRSSHAPYSDDVTLEKQSTELSEETKELLAVYHKTFDDDRVDLDLIYCLIDHICNSGQQGAVLVFLPGYDDIITLRDILASSKEYGNTKRYQLFTLHSSMQPGEQRKVFRKLPPTVRKIVLSTNIAETSVTIDDVVFVIDSGKVKEKSFDALTSVSTLQVAWVSKASAVQRRGRAGRCSPGTCYHLFSGVRYESLQPYQIPELLRMPLQELCLHAKLLAGPNTCIADFLAKAPEPPTYLVLRNAVTLLKTIDALNKWEDLTDLGRHLADLPVEPRLGKMILYSVVLKCLDPVITVACALAYRDPFVLPMYAAEKRAAAVAKRRFIIDQYSDHLLFVKAFRGWQKARAEGLDKSFCQRNYLSPASLEMMSGMKSQIIGHLKTCGFIRPRGAGDLRDLNTNSNNWAVVKAALCAGMYPQIARVDRLDNKLTTPKETKVRIHTSSILYQAPEKNESQSLSQAKAVKQLPSDWLIYEEMTRMYTSVSVKCCTAVHPIAVALFAGPSLSAPNLEPGEDKSRDTERRNSEGRWESESSDSDAEESKPGDKSRDNQAELKVDDWISMLGSDETVELASFLRHKLQIVFMRRIRAPSRPWSQVDETVVRAVVAVLSAEEERINPELYPKQRRARPESSYESRSRVERQRPGERYSRDRIGRDVRESGASPRPDSSSNQQGMPRMETSSARSSPVQDKISEARFFIMKCNNQRNLDISMAKGIWATTIANEKKLNRAFKESKKVVLIFSVQGSGHFQGVAHMTSPIGREKSPEFGSSSLGGVFTVEWITKANIPFQQAHHLVNPWNDHKKVQISRDGQELEPSIGAELCKLWEVDHTNTSNRYSRPVSGATNNSRRGKLPPEGNSGKWQHGIGPVTQQPAVYPTVYAPHAASMPIPVPVPAQHSRQTLLQAYPRPAMTAPQPIRSQPLYGVHPHMRNSRYPGHVIPAPMQPQSPRGVGSHALRPGSYPQQKR